MDFATNMFRTVSARLLSKCDSFTSAFTSSSFIFRATIWIFSTAAMFSMSRADATTISVNDIFEILEQASMNNTGASTSPVLFIGADDVVPNGNNGTTGVATFPAGSTTPTLIYPLLNESSTAFPNQISTGIGANAIPYTGSNLLNPWTLTFANSSTSPTLTTVSTLALPSDTTLPAFANNVTITGGTTTPQISWVGSGNAVFINIVDLNENGNTIYSRGGLPASGSFQIPSGILNTTDAYQIQVAEVHTRDGSTNTMHDNEAAISRALFNYTVSTSAPAVPLNIPMIDSSGVFHFNMTVSAGTTTYIDPAVATGYIYEIGAGNPNFASVTLPILPDQTNPYEIEWDNGVDTAFVVGGQTFDFAGLGVSTFDVTGIDAANGLNPQDPTAFITALTFEGSGPFTGTMTPIIPEPSTWAMVLVGFAGLGYVGYYRRFRRARIDAPA